MGVKMKLAFALNISVFQFKLESRILKHVTYISVETERRYELSALGVQVQWTVNMYKKTCVRCRTSSYALNTKAVNDIVM